MKLRSWQVECESKFARSASGTFLINALPGAGKTVTAGAIAKRQFMARSERGQMLVIVPTDHMRSQWQGVMSSVFGIELDDQVSATPRRGFHGLVTTYAGMASQAETLAQYAAKAPTFAICDEVHHAGASSAWGIAMEVALARCDRRLMLSGTPFRHDGTRIPFLTVQSTDDGGDEYVADYTYDFEQALRDKVVRALTFKGFDGRARYELDGVEQLELLSTAGSLKTPTVMRLLLNDDTFLRALLTEAHQNLQYQRARIPDAAGLVIGIDGAHAVRLARVLEGITGTPPCIVVSDSAKATTSVKAFGADPAREWVVAVRMISEGIDIPRLMTLALCTNVTTRLYFRQAVGRVVRRRGDHDTLAHVFYPASAVLRQHAREIEAVCAIAAAVEKEEDPESADDEPPPGGPEFCRSGAFLIDVTDFGVSGEMNKGHDGTMQLGFAPAAAEPTLAERMDALRSEINTLVSRYGRMAGVDARVIHSRYKNNRSRTPQAKMSLQQLEAKRDYVRLMVTRHGKVNKALGAGRGI